MADAIYHLMERLKITIPDEILHLAFKPDTRQMSLDSCILEDLIYKKLFADINLVAGRLTEIFLRPEWVEEAKIPHSSLGIVSTSYNIYRVPRHARENRSISSVISCAFPYGAYNSPQGTMMASSTQGNTLGSLAGEVLGGHTLSGMSKTPTPILLGGDLIKLTPVNAMWATTATWVLTCRLEYDKELTNMNSSAILKLCDLAECLTKSYIYNLLVIKIDKMYTESGQEIGAVKDIVTGWSSEMENYNEKLMNFHSSAYHNDPERNAKYLYYQL